MQEKSENASPVWIKSIKEILHDRWNESISLQELAHSLGLHPVTVSKHFPRYFNCTLGEYMRKIKIEKAIAQISKDEFSLTQVAHNCGFFDQSHFIRAFKQATGFLPGAYKKL
jgi:AraC family transcriptional regulator